VAAIFIQYFNQ